MSYQINWVTEYLCVGRAPMSYDDFDDIKSHGIRAIVNLCAEFTDLHELEEQAGFEVCYLPIHDECAPDMEKMEAALQWFDEAMYLKKKVLVHCRHGMGRTGTFVSAYLLRRGLGLKAAEKTLKTTRALPTNYSQWKLLKQYGKKQGGKLAREPSIQDAQTVDLSQFFSSYKNLLLQASKQDGAVQTEKIHIDTCCTQYFELQFIEAIFVSTSMNLQLSSTARQQAIKQALDVAKQSGVSKCAANEAELTNREESWKGAKWYCPLVKDGRCQIGEDRPLRCHFSLEGDFTGYKESVEKLSRDVFSVLTGSTLDTDRLRFPMHDVISGRFVQHYFQAMLEQTVQK